MRLLIMLLAVCYLFSSAGVLRVPAQAGGKRVVRPSISNSWRGITPLQSTSDEVAAALDLDREESEMLIGPYAVDGGEVTFSYITSAQAKIYRAPANMIGKVFTIYFRPGRVINRAELSLAPGFKTCHEDLDKSYYYLVNDAGVAYQFRRTTNRVETIIYQPSRAQVRRLSVATACVF